MKVKPIMLVALLLLSLRPALAQKRNDLRGRLHDEAGKPVSNASVSIIHGQRVVAFKSSDSDGRFWLSWRDTIALESLKLKVNHLGFQQVTIPVVAGKEYETIVMKESAIDLAEVTVKSKPRIDLRGDTLAYNVSSFSKAEDRSIGDVLRRMPGMEVDERGSIKYNGQSISNLYIDGDDLLEDGYGIGTKSIPHGIVSDVEVLQRHQPKKVLEGIALSDAVALNLKITEEAKLALAGQATVGGGLPNIVDGSMEAMLFNKRYKMLNTLAANNAAKDLRADFNNSAHQSGLVSPGTVGNPTLPTNRYYFNKSGALHANNLLNLRTGLQLKSTIGLLADRNNLGYQSRNELYLAGDTVRYTETQQTGQKPFIVSAGLQAQANLRDYFFKHAVSFDYSGTDIDAALTDHAATLKQQLSRRVRSFNNTLEYIPAINDRTIFDVNWRLAYNNKPETLRIHPGIHADVLNSGIPFDAVSQSIHTPSWNHGLSVGFRRPTKGLSQHYSLRINNEWQQLQTALRLLQPNGNTDSSPVSKDNNLLWQRHELQAQTTQELSRKHWDVLIGVPVTWQRINYQDRELALAHTRPYLFINPFLNANYKTNPEDRLAFNYVYNTQLGNRYDVYRGVVLTNYRSLEANLAELQAQRVHNLRLGYQLQRNISMLFANAGVEYAKAQSNTIASRIMDNNISRTVLVPYKNDVSSFSVSAGISKYLFSLGATTGLKGAWNSTRYNQFLNGQLLPYRNLSSSLTPSIEFRFQGGASLNYEATGTWTKSRLATTETDIRIPDRRLQRYDQSLNILYAPFENTFIRLSGRHQFIRQDHVDDIKYLFMDANVRYKLKRWRTDLELDITNITNINSYETYSLSANQLAYNRYQLRGTLVLLKATFNI